MIQKKPQGLLPKGAIKKTTKFLIIGEALTFIGTYTLWHFMNTDQCE